MSALRRNYLTFGNLGPVKIAQLERPGGVVEGYEVSFQEAAPATRNSRFVWVLKILAFYACIVPFFWFVVWSPAYIEAALQGYFFYNPADYWAASIPGALLLIPVLLQLLPPHRSSMRVVMVPARDELSIYRRGKLIEHVPLSEVRGVSIEHHPDLEDAFIDLQMKQSHDNRLKVNHYRQTENVYLIIGQTVAAYVIEVASFMGKKAQRTTMTMRVRAALEIAWQMATGQGGQVTAGQQIQPEPHAAPSQNPLPRRRRARLT